MNDQLIETILRRAPAPKAPRNLHERLIADIDLGRSTAATPVLSSDSWLKRWLPAMSYGGLAAACLGVVALESNQLSEARHENEALRAQAQDLTTLRAANAEVQKLRVADGELDRLRHDSAEIPRLEDEIARLQAQIDALPQLRAENDRLKSAVAGIPGALPDFFAEAKARAERISCVNNLKQVGLAAGIWANDHGGKYPSDFISMTNELTTWKILQDPGDETHSITNWDQVAAGDLEYKIVATGLTVNDNPEIVLYECPRHHIIALLDGSVQQLSEENMIKMIVTDDKGRRVYSPNQNQ